MSDSAQSPSSKHQTRKCLSEEWDSISPVKFQKRKQSVPKSFEAALAAHGGPSSHQVYLL